MLSNTRSLKFSRLALLLIALVGVLAVQVALQTRLAQASSSQADCYQSTENVETPWAIDPTQRPGIMCGKLVFIEGYYPKINGHPRVSTIGVIPCGQGKPLIFGVHPRSLVPYYQFRDPKTGRGQMICSEKYGCLDQYLVSFKNYVGIESCSECGKYGLPPTWTDVPLTPYTFTPVPPTSTPWPTRVTPTATRTLSPDEITPTLELFDLLHGASDTPTASATAKPTLAGTPTAPSTPTATPAPQQSLIQRIGPIALILLALLALLVIPLVSVVRDYLRER